jgi:ribonuclease HII
LVKNQILVAGLDEVGRGPWAGPIISCAYIEKISVSDVKITDSKKMNHAQREIAYERLTKAGFFGIGEATPQEIDQLGLSKAHKLSFKRAIAALIKSAKVKPDFIMIDGRDKIDLSVTHNIPFKTIIKGDLTVHVISCASIIAKVTRDRLMEKLSKKYPQYAFEKHKGYGTREHKNLLKKHGASAIHRCSYKPVQSFIHTKKSEKFSD